MKNTNDNLLASIAVFAELCNTEESIQGILSRFIKAVFAFEQSWALDTSEIGILLRDHFDFDVPDAVVKTCLNGLTKEGFCIRKNNKYAVVDTSYSAVDFETKLAEKKARQDSIELELVDYYESLLGVKISEQDRKTLIYEFISYLLDNIVSEKSLTVISSFLVHKSANKDFVNELNQIKEGIVLVTGLGYTHDLNELGAWKGELTIYLDTEHLFNACGYNGILYEKLFDDFTSLVNEINGFSMRKSQKKLIQLKYFKDIEDEVNRFFFVAEKIIRKEGNLSPENIAMEEICKGCTQVSDIIKKKTQFETNLKTRGISVQEEFEVYENPEFNVEDQSFITKYEGQFEEQQLVQTLRLFTKINVLRKGRSRTSFEECRHIILTGRTLTRLLSYDLEVKNEKKDIPFATDIYFITNRLWYKLNKGLAKGNNLPSTLDIVTKARVVLSSQVDKSIAKKYDDLKAEIKSGKIDQSHAQELYFNLRERAKRPEEIDSSNLEESLDFIFDNDLEKYVREKSILQERARIGEEAISRLKKLERESKVKERSLRKSQAKISYRNMLGAAVIAVCVLPFVIWALLKNLITVNDTPIGIIGFVLGLILPVWGWLKFEPIKRSLLRTAIRRQEVNGH